MTTDVTTNEISNRRTEVRVERAFADGGIEAVLLLLTDKQRNFVEEYLKDFNGTASLSRAGYAASPRNAGRTVGELLAHPAIKLALAHYTKLRAETYTVDSAYITKRWMKLVEASEEAALGGNSRAAATLLRASELLAKSIGMFIERTEVTGAGGSAIQIEEVNDAAAAFTRTIAGLAARGRTDSVSDGVDLGGESGASL